MTSSSRLHLYVDRDVSISRWRCGEDADGVEVRLMLDEWGGGFRGASYYLMVLVTSK